MELLSDRFKLRDILESELSSYSDANIQKKLADVIVSNDELIKKIAYKAISELDETCFKNVLNVISEEEKRFILDSVMEYGEYVENVLAFLDKYGQEYEDVIDEFYDYWEYEQINCLRLKYLLDEQGVKKLLK